jgi:hypothetical protein
MCDYSLGGLPNRLAEEGEELIVHRFSTGSVGLASARELCPARPVEKAERPKTLWQSIRSFFELSPDPQAVRAVCVPPGASLTWKAVPPDLQEKWNLPETTEVRFVQVSAEVNRYRDAIELPSGRRILLQELREGLQMRIVCLGGTSEGVEEPALQMSLR